MVFITVLAALVAALTGLAAKYVLEYLVRREIVRGFRITWREFTAAAVVSCAIVTPVVTYAGKKLSVDQILTYQEMRSGVETSADVSRTTCRGGHPGRSVSAGQSNCRYAYDSGVRYHWDEETEIESCSTDAKGVRTCTKTKIVTHHSASIYLPYAKFEYRFSVTNSLNGTDNHGRPYDGVYNYPGVYLGDNPEPYGSRAIPDNIPRGAPADWKEAKQRLDEGDPRSVTGQFDYDNYILASQDKILAPYAGDVDLYLKKGLLPDHTANILKNPIYGTSRSMAKKFSFAGMNVPNEADWQESLMRFNAAFGSKFFGDLHVVAVDSSLIDNPHGYMKAMRAYWMGDHFKKRALGKNGVILVMGVSAGKVEWAEADTAMPYGNNIMLEAMQSRLVDAPFNPDAIFGKTRTLVTPAAAKGEKPQVELKLSSPMGVLEDVMFARPESQFHRPCMKCEDKEDAGQVGFKNLIAQIEPTQAQKTWMIIIVWLFSLVFWGVVSFTSVFEARPSELAGRVYHLIRP